MAINLSDSIRVGQQKPVDDKYFNGLSPYTSTAQVLLLVPVTQRHQGLKVNIAGVEYWFKDGIADINLVEYTTGSSGGGSQVNWTDINGKPTEFPPSAHTHEISDINDLQGELNDKIDVSEKGANNGVATLDNNGKIPVSQVSAGVFVYKGIWNASTNTPTLTNGTGTNGWIYKVNGAGTVNFGAGNITFAGGEFVRYNDAGIWEKDTNTDIVSSVNGQTGDVQIRFEDLSDIPTLAGNGGKVIAINTGEDNIEYIEIPNGVYDGASPSTTSVGGVPSGYVLTGKTFTEIFQQMLVVYQSPAFSSFTISGQSTLIEVGTTLSGNKTFLWTTSNSGNVQANSVNIRDITANTLIATGIANDGTEVVNIGVIGNSAPISRSWRAEALNSNLGEFNSSSFTVNSIYPVFYYKSATPIDEDTMASAIENGLTTKLLVDSTGTITIPFAANGEYLCVAYPSISTTKTKWFVTVLDNGTIPGGLFNAVVTRNVDSPTGLWSNVTYKIHTTSGPITQALPIQLQN